MLFENEKCLIRAAVLSAFAALPAVAQQGLDEPFQAPSSRPGRQDGGLHPVRHEFRPDRRLGSHGVKRRSSPMA